MLGLRDASVGLCASLALIGSVSAQVGPDGVDWCTIGAPGNRAYDGPDPFNLVSGRGSVNYEYKIGRYEVTTAQWMDFFNAALARPDPLPFAAAGWWSTPILWGATRDTTYTGPGTRYRLRTDIPNAGMLPVGGISWRMAAVLCNWYENDRGTSQSAFMNGAYDVTTFNGGSFPTFTDQPMRSPGSRYAIPTLDEWMKAVHYDPNADGGAGRWWQQPNGTDTPLIYGPPPSFGGDGTAQANAGFNLSGNAHYRIPLGSYSMVTSPWGLLDAAGATAEWIEDIRTVDNRMYRRIDGSSWGGTFGPGHDDAWGVAADSPHLRLTGMGFRIASSVPGPSWIGVILTLGGLYARRSPRKGIGHDEGEALFLAGRASGHDGCDRVAGTK